MRYNGSMIHGTSNDPVLIKKIALRIWSLRDEVEAVVEGRLAAGQESSDVEILDLIDEYKLQGKGANPDNVVPLHNAKGEEASPTTQSEDQETQKNSDETNSLEDSEKLDDNSEQVENSDSSKDKDSTEKSESDDKKVLVFQRVPKIPESKLTNGKTLLQEVYMDKMYFFCSRPYLEGQSIVIEFLVPKKFIVNADVVYCRQYSMKSRIIGENKLPYRAAVKFTYLKEGERTLLRNFIESIEPDTEKIKPQKIDPKLTTPKDDFDELDDFKL